MVRLLHRLDEGIDFGLLHSGLLEYRSGCGFVMKIVTTKLNTPRRP